MDTNDDLPRKRRHPCGAPTAVPPLEGETRSRVDTATAAYHLNRRPKTLRSWASSGAGCIQPLRINGRLTWSVARLRELLNAEGK
jgi:hypothetical protein